MNINELSKEAHKNAVAHGWWEEERPFAELIALMHSEFSEALEEYRDGRGLNEIYYSCTAGGRGNENCLFPGVRPCPEKCKNLKPEGIPIELADAIIRIADYFGRYKVKVEELEVRTAIRAARKEVGTLCELLAHCHWLLGMAYASEEEERRRGNICGRVVASEEEELRFSLMALLVDHTQGFCGRNGIDLDDAIRLKMEYNKTRPYKHGKKI